MSIRIYTDYQRYGDTYVPPAPAYSMQNIPPELLEPVDVMIQTGRTETPVPGGKQVTEYYNVGKVSPLDVTSFFAPATPKTTTSTGWRQLGFMGAVGAGGIEPYVMEDAPESFFAPSPTQMIFDWSQGKDIHLPDITTTTSMAGATGIIPAGKVKGIDINPAETFAGAVGSVESIWNPNVPSVGGAVMETFTGSDYNRKFLAEHPFYLQGAGAGEALQFAIPSEKVFELMGKGSSWIPKGLGGVERGLFLGDQPISRLPRSLQKAVFLGDQPLGRYSTKELRHWFNNDIFLPISRKLGFGPEAPDFATIPRSGSGLKYGYKSPYKAWQSYADMTKVSIYAERPTKTTFSPVLEMEAHGGKSQFIGGGVRTVRGDLVEVGERRWIPTDDLTNIRASMGETKLPKGQTALTVPTSFDVSTSFAGKGSEGIGMVSKGKLIEYSSFEEQFVGKRFKSVETHLGIFDKFGEAWEFAKKAKSGIGSDFIEIPKHEGAAIAGKVKGPMKPFKVDSIADGAKQIAKQMEVSASPVSEAGKGLKVLPVIEEKLPGSRYGARRLWSGGYAAAEELEDFAPAVRNADDLIPGIMKPFARTSSFEKLGVGYGTAKSITTLTRPAAGMGTSSITGGIGKMSESYKVGSGTSAFDIAGVKDIINAGTGSGSMLGFRMDVQPLTKTVQGQRTTQLTGGSLATAESEISWIKNALDYDRGRGGGATPEPAWRIPRIHKMRRSDDDPLIRMAKRSGGSYEERINPFNENFIRDLRKVKL